VGVFEDLHRDEIYGSLAMYDRMIFKGRLTGLYKQNGAKCFLWTQGVALKDFTPYAKATTARIADNARGLAEAAGRPVISFDHVKTRNYSQRKEDLARSIAERDGITDGIICVISAVESCMSFQVRKSFKTKTIEMTRRERKCLHHYLYVMDPEFGFMHIRIQGWIPYDCQVYITTSGWPASWTRPASAMSATTTRCCASRTWRGTVALAARWARDGLQRVGAFGQTAWATSSKAAATRR
jgi:hypothetical protein